MTRALLSRVAESIFWVGRYVERAEGTARILDVSVYQALEQSDVEGVARRPPAAGRDGPARLGDRDPVAGDRAPGHRSHEPVVHRRRPGGGAGEHPRRAPRRPGRVLGAHQRHLGRAAAALGDRPAGGPGLLPLLRQDAVRRHDGPGRHHDEPGPDVALLHPRPVPRAHRRGGPPAGHRGLRRGVRQRPRHVAALLRRLRAVPAPVPGRRGAGPRPRLPAARPALPALGLRLAHPGRGVPRPDQRRARRRLGRRPRPGRPGPGRARVLGSGDAGPRASRPGSSGCRPPSPR